MLNIKCEYPSLLYLLQKIPEGCHSFIHSVYVLGIYDINLNITSLYIIFMLINVGSSEIWYRTLLILSSALVPTIVTNYTSHAFD